MHNTYDANIDSPLSRSPRRVLVADTIFQGTV